MHRIDVAVIGGGIVGLAHAWAAARRGLSVALFERDPRAQGASVRNFGMVWPIGQAPGEMHRRAMTSRARWLELAEQAGVRVRPCGSLHLAYRDDEAAVLEEFVAGAGANRPDCALLPARRVLERCPAVNPDGLKAGLWSGTELCVDPRQAVARLPEWLRETFGVQTHFGTAVTAVAAPRLRSADGRAWEASRILVCGGVDFQTLFPVVYAAAGLRLCKLQMMRTVPQPGGWQLGPHLAGGLTLAHYPGFATCPALPALKERVAAELPEYVRYGIHVMAAQNHLGEVVIGDSHEYDADVEPFDKPRIDELILTYLRGLVRLPDWSVAGRWHGLYAKHPNLPLVRAEPQPGVTVLAAIGGMGMTLSFGFADEFWESAEG